MRKTKMKVSLFNKFLGYTVVVSGSIGISATIASFLDIGLPGAIFFLILLLFLAFYLFEKRILTIV